ncbi:unnamed protein product [Prunus armeniaca]|uniref:Uncharacterized protein n=1 Tax=Prunus armeniaca TaxID=36596 RepID=A0A6J5XRG6_PRUAR|nr:unnamed protein product [Prunus armeniaca]
MTFQFLETVEFFQLGKALVVHISHQSRRRDQNKIASAGINLKVQWSVRYNAWHNGWLKVHIA